MARNTISLIFVSLFIQLSYGQDYHKITLTRGERTKTIKVRSGDDFTFWSRPQVEGAYDAERRVYGNLSDVDQSGLTIYPVVEETNIKYHDGIEENTYRNFFGVGLSQEVVPHSSITSIGHHNKVKKDFFIGAAIGGFLGLLTATVVAPLVSMDYSEGKINPDQYNDIARVGLYAIGASIPLMLITNGKRYRLDGKKPWSWGEQ